MMKHLPILTIICLFVGVITFNACKKDTSSSQSSPKSTGHITANISYYGPADETAPSSFSEDLYTESGTKLETSTQGTENGFKTVYVSEELNPGNYILVVRYTIQKFREVKGQDGKTFKIPDGQTNKSTNEAFQISANVDKTLEFDLY